MTPLRDDESPAGGPSLPCGPLQEGHPNIYFQLGVASSFDHPSGGGDVLVVTTYRYPYVSLVGESPVGGVEADPSRLGRRVSAQAWVAAPKADPGCPDPSPVTYRYPET